MLFHHNQPQTRFAGWAYLCLLALFAAIATAKPVVGFTGLGAVLVLGSISVLANKESIYKNYVKQYKKAKKSKTQLMLSAPSETIYKLNVYVAWPLLLVTGLLSILVAYSIY